ncbi:MAG: replication factor C small subunit [archaeon]
MIEIWTEKYRPKKLAEVRGQNDIIARLEAFVSNKNMPHILFAGPAGIGKTTAALAIAHELYGDTWRDNILELNASDARGIDVIRGAVKDFARTKSVENVPFKIIYLDECDALTKEAQDALRRIMEDYVQTTRFILSCNYSSKVIPPIQSRCAIFRFKPLPKDVVEAILCAIVKAEGYTIESKALELIYEASEGDMRKAENLLQACAATLKRDGEENIISLKNISQIISFAEPKEIEAVVKLALAGNFLDSKKKLTDVMVAHGLSGIDIIKQIQKEVWDLKLDERIKIELVRICGEIEFRMVEGANEFIQLASLLAEFAAVGCAK